MPKKPVNFDVLTALKLVEENSFSTTREVLSAARAEIQSLRETAVIAGRLAREVQDPENYHPDDIRHLIDVADTLAAQGYVEDG